MIETALEHLSASSSPELIPKIADAAQQLNLNLDNTVEKPCWEMSLENTSHSLVEVKMGLALQPVSIRYYYLRVVTDTSFGCDYQHLLLKNLSI